MQFIEGIQPNEEEREFLLTYLSHALYENMLEWFTILTGAGRNGKSKLIELIKIRSGIITVLSKAKCLLGHNPTRDLQIQDC